MTTPRRSAIAHARPRSGDPAGLVLDVRALPTYGFGHRSLMWWSTMGLMLIEGTVFAVAVMMYFYLRSMAPAWPMAAIAPDLRWGTLNTIVLVASLMPNQFAKRAAEREDLERTRIWLAICLLASVAFLAIRGFEFAALNVNWYTNAYGISSPTRSTPPCSRCCCSPDRMKENASSMSARTRSTGISSC